MANTCNTNLSIQRTESKRDIAEMSEEIKKFIDDNIAYQMTPDEVYCDEDTLEIYVSTRWNVPVKELSEMCKQFSVRCRAWGVEEGVGFIQVVHIEDTGQVLSDEELPFNF